MTRGRLAVLLLTVACLALGAGYFARIWLLTPETDKAQVVLAAAFDDLDGKRQAIAQWKGKVLVVNFWATWCPPCREEIPEFIKLQDKYRAKDLLFVGIAVDDKEKVRAFAKRVGMNYPVLIGDLAAIDLSRNAGNRLGGLPYTVVIDRNGNVAFTEIGARVGDLDAKLKPLL